MKKPAAIRALPGQPAGRISLNILLLETPEQLFTFKPRCETILPKKGRKKKAPVCIGGKRSETLNHLNTLPEHPGSSHYYSY